MLSKKSKIEELRKSRKGHLVVSVAASLCVAGAKVCDRFAAIRCGPSRCTAWLTLATSERAPNKYAQPAFPRE
jgi:hypothetical protein